MDFLKNIYDYFRGSNKKCQDEIKFTPNLENDTQNIVEIPRVAMDLKLPEYFFINNFGGSELHDDNGILGFHLMKNVPSLLQMMDQFEETLREIDIKFGGSVEFHNFFKGNFEDMRDGMLREPEKRLTGEKLRNYYLNGNTATPQQGENQIVILNDKEYDDYQTDLMINNNNSKSDLATTPYFNKQSRIFTAKVGQDGIAEITTVLIDESGNEERTVRKVKLF